QHHGHHIARTAAQLVEARLQVLEQLAQGWNASPGTLPRPGVALPVSGFIPSQAQSPGGNGKAGNQRRPAIETECRIELLRAGAATPGVRSPAVSHWGGF